jgi:hypothetical protein
MTIELVVPIPEDAEQREAQKITEERRAIMSQSPAQFATRMAVSELRHFELEDEDGHRDRKDAVEEDLQAGSADRRFCGGRAVLAHAGVSDMDRMRHLTLVGVPDGWRKASQRIRDSTRVANTGDLEYAGSTMKSSSRSDSIAGF